MAFVHFVAKARVLGRGAPADEPLAAPRAREDTGCGAGSPIAMRDATESEVCMPTRPSLPSLPSPPPTTDDERALHPRRVSERLEHEADPPNGRDGDVADRLESYGKSQFRRHGGQGRERERDWEQAPPDVTDEPDDVPAAVPSSGYRPVE